MATGALELSHIKRENVTAKNPDFQRLHSEESAAIRRPPGIKKSISWGNRSDYTRSLSPQALTVAVFLVEKSGRLLNLEEGRNTEAGTINTIMSENLSLPPIASQVFCVWLISPLLQLQLKSHHRPFRLRQVWPELLRKFTNTPDEVCEKDEPILCYQRSSFFPLAEERRVSVTEAVNEAFENDKQLKLGLKMGFTMIKDDRVVRRLFEEAKHNVLCGNYPISSKDALTLGGILAYIDNGKYDKEEHVPGCFKNKLTDYLPAWVCKSNWPFLGRSPNSAIEHKLLQEYENVSQQVSDVKACHKMFLEYCWNFSFYGSVFFRGQIERPTSSLLSNILGNSDLPVRVAINREGVHVIDDNKNDILLSLAFEELSWDYTPAPAHEPGCLDTFWLEFDAPDRSSDPEEAVQRLQIFSKQAEMMDAMVESCVLCDESGPHGTLGKVRCRVDRLSLSTLEGTLDRKKGSNRSFTMSNPFRKRHSTGH